jgi:metal-responsive CopG/Arc/MetJ family transcriptional regulator
MMAEEKKERYPIWMRPDMVLEVDSMLKANDFRSRSEFVCKAVDFYIGYLSAKRSENYLLSTLVSVQENQLKLVERDISRILFKLAVETDIALNVTAHMSNIDMETLQTLRRKCVQDVKKTIGVINFDEAFRYQKHMDKEQNENDQDSEGDDQ